MEAAFNRNIQPWFKGLPENGFKRIISLVPSQTELLFDLGAGEQVIGVTKFCIHPNEAMQNASIIGGTKAIHYERIARLNPDLIIGNKEENTQEIIETLGASYNLWCTDILDLTTAFAAIQDMAWLIHKEEIGDVLLQKIKAEQASLPKLEPKKVAYLIWNEPIMAAASGTFINAMLDEAGFENVLGYTERYPEITIELLQTLNPEYLFLSSEPFPFKERHLDYFQEQLPNTNVLIVDGEMFSWYGSRLLKSFTYFSNLRKSLNI